MVRFLKAAFKKKDFLNGTFMSLMVSVFFSCSKKHDDNNSFEGLCSDFSSPYVNNDGPVQSGGSLRLTAISNEQNIKYQWTGPNNFSSELQYPVISNISFDAGGTYYARVINGECISNSSSTNVIVAAPCNIADNTGVFGTETWNFNSAISCFINSSGYLMVASSMNGDLKIRFAPDHTPQLNKIYKVDNPSTAAFDSTEVQLTITKSSGNTYLGQSGNVYVSNFGNLSVVYCNIPFKSGTTGDLLTGEAKIDCQ